MGKFVCVCVYGNTISEKIAVDGVAEDQSRYGLVEHICCLFSSSEDDVEVNKEVAKPARERREENRRTRDKMKLVRSQMERCSLLKEKKDKVNVIISVMLLWPLH